MSGQELRKEPRFAAAMLPASLRSVRILLAGSEIMAKVIDASYSGFGFQIQKSVENFILGSSLVIYPKESASAIYGVVVYAKPLAEGLTRVGIQLKEVGHFKEYREDLRRVLSQRATIQN